MVLTRLKLLKGEWFVDVSQGIAWLTDVVGVRTAGTRDRAIRNCILGTQGVKSIVSYSSSVVGRAFTASVTIDTIYGEAGLSLSRAGPGPLDGRIDWSVPGNIINTTV